MLLIYSRQVSRKVFQRYYRNIERVAVTDKPCRLVAGIAIEDPCKHQWLVGNKTYSASVDPAKANHYVCCPKLLHFKELRTVGNCLDHIPYIVGFCRIDRDNLIDFEVLGIGLFYFFAGTFALVVGRDIVQKGLYLLEALLFTVGKKVCVAGDLAMDTCPSKGFHIDLFAQYRFDYLRPCDEHLGNLVHYKYKVGKCG
ncbi:hypothetical protein SDC9_187352 [bioreactor metagenome]|uniref:Uncharacterized protein n=1 Tax=bioreactor metagenome TaxID=1076179 RepID=A0A645HLD9_9ZZZZ